MKVKRFVKGIQNLIADAERTMFGFVLAFFESVNRKIRSRISFWHMEEETIEHVNMLAKVFKYVILPASIFYVCADFYFFGENSLDSMFWGILIFFYGNFLPDLPSIYRRKEKVAINRDLPWYKKYALLLLAPLFIWLLFSGIRLTWKTTETFHNLKSLATFGVFLLLLGFFAFGQFPIGIGGLTEIFSLPFYGLIGYLSHLKVDKIW